MLKNNNKKKIIMKDGWIIQKEKGKNTSKVRAIKQKTLKDKAGNVIGHTSVYKEVSFTSSNEPIMNIEIEHDYDLEDDGFNNKFSKEEDFDDDDEVGEDDDEDKL